MDGTRVVTRQSTSICRHLFSFRDESATKVKQSALLSVRVNSPEGLSIRPLTGSRYPDPSSRSTVVSDLADVGTLPKVGDTNPSR